MIPCYQAYCGECKFCKHPESNLCVSVRAFTGASLPALWAEVNVVACPCHNASPSRIIDSGLAGFTGVLFFISGSLGGFA